MTGLQAAVPKMARYRYGTSAKPDPKRGVMDEALGRADLVRIAVLLLAIVVCGIFLVLGPEHLLSSRPRPPPLGQVASAAFVGDRLTVCNEEPLFFFPRLTSTEPSTSNSYVSGTASSV